MESKIQNTLFFLAELWVHCFHLQSETWCLIWICYKAEIGRTFFSQLFDYEFQKESSFPHIAEHSDLFKTIGTNHRRDLEHSGEKGMLYFHRGYHRVRRQSKAHLQQAQHVEKSPKTSISSDCSLVVPHWERILVYSKFLHEWKFFSHQS